MTPQDYELHPANRLVLAFPLFFGGVLPLVAFAVLIANTREPASWMGAIPLLFMPIVAALITWSMVRRVVRLSDAGLRIRTLPWPRTIPVTDFELDKAEIVDLESRPELMPRFKIVGTRLPGYCAGRFRLRDKRHASVFLTGFRRVLVLPKGDGSLVMLSLVRPDALLKALQQRGATQRG